MEKLNMAPKIVPVKKVFFRKEIEADRLGEELYAEDVLSQYSVYMLRKFEQGEEYQTPEQFNSFLETLPVAFNGEFEDCVVRNMYVRVTQKAVYLTFLLALAHPLSKLQISDLRTWISHLEVPELPLEHVSNFSNQATSEMIKDIQETNGEVLLLSEMMDQFNEHLAELYIEIQTVKQSKTPPIFKIVPSKATVKETQETFSSQQIAHLEQQLSQLVESFTEFEKETNNRFKKLPKPKKPPKFKIIRGAVSEKEVANEQQLDQALTQIDQLTKQLQAADQQLVSLDKKVDQLKKKRPSVSFAKATYASPLSEQVTETHAEVTSLLTKMDFFDQKIETIESDINQVKPIIGTITHLEEEQESLQATSEKASQFEKTIGQLSEQLETLVTDFYQEKNEKKKIPVLKLTKSDGMKQMVAERLRNQERLKANATEIKKLTQLVSKVDVQLIKAHQKIAELEQKMRQQPTVAPIKKAVKTEHPTATQAVVTAKKPIEKTTSTEKDVDKEQSSFPTKEVFLQSSRPKPATPTPEREKVTLAIEEVLDRVSEQPPIQTINDPLTETVTRGNQLQGASLAQLKTLEWSIHALFQKTRSLGHKGMVAKDVFHSNIYKVEALPVLWDSLYEREKQDVLLGNDLSCQQLMNELPEFLESVKRLSQKRKVMGKWISCPKEMEQKLEGYTLLSDYLEGYMARPKNR